MAEIDNYAEKIRYAVKKGEDSSLDSFKYAMNHFDDCTTVGSIDTATGWSNAGDYYTYDPAPAIQISGALDLNGMDVEKEINKLNKFKNEKEKEDMMYLWEVILVDPKTDLYEIFEVTAKSETSALMEAYMLSQTEEDSELNNVEFDDLKTSCKVLFEWKKEKDLKKAIETIKDAVK